MTPFDDNFRYLLHGTIILSSPSRCGPAIECYCPSDHDGVSHSIDLV